MDTMSNADFMKEFVTVKGVINTKKLLKHLYGDKTKQPRRTASKPSGLTPGLNLIRDDTEHLTKSVMSFIGRNKTEAYYVKAIIELLFLYGLRISEALAITHHSITKSGLILIKGKKGSEDRFIRPVMFLTFWKHYKACEIDYSFVYSRQYFYRVLKKYGFYASYGNNTKMSVTHMFRHEYARDIQLQFKDLEIVKKGIGHKSIKSTQYYDKDQKAKGSTIKGNK